MLLWRKESKMHVWIYGGLTFLPSQCTFGRFNTSLGQTRTLSPILKKGNDSFVQVLVSSKKGYENASALVVTSWKAEMSRVMEYKCPYNMYPRNEYLEDLELK